MTVHSFRVFHVRKWLRGALIVLLPLLIGGLAGFLTRKNTVFYEVLIKPPFAPPGAVFPLVWSVLYILMGVAALLILNVGGRKPFVRDAMNYFAFQLLLNFLWPIVFFNMRSLLFSFLVLLIMWIFVGICTAKFYRIQHIAGWLLLPAWLWTTFAGYINIAVWLLNR